MSAMPWPYRRVYEVTGYAHNASAYCPDCATTQIKREGGAIFLGSEWDYSPCCDVCGEEIEITLIGRE